MALKKARRADLRGEYPIYVEIGLAAALGVCVLAAQANIQPRQADDSYYRLLEQERIELDEISQTKQHDPIPPPPRPSIPIAVPDEEILPEDELNFDASLTIHEAIGALPSPPPPAQEPAAEAEEEDVELFVIVEEMPQLIGGLDAIQRELNYPEIAMRAGLEGRVFVQFIVEPDGSVSEPVVIRGIGGGCDEEAVRAISLARFEPGRQRGKPVRVKMSIPVRFRLVNK
jgi:protein TonB